MKNSEKFNLKYIDLYSILKDIVKNFWIIILAGAIGLMITYTGIRNSYVPTYTSSAIYVVSPRESTGYVYTNKRAAESVVTVFQGLLETDIMKNSIEKDVGLRKLNAVISANLLEGTNLIKISVSDTSPSNAFLILQSTMNNYANLSEYLNEDVVFEVLKEAVVPTVVDTSLTPRGRSLQMGSLSALLMAAIVIMMSIFRKTVKNEAIITDKIRIPFYGKIYHETKNRTIKSKLKNSVKSILVTSPVVGFRFIEAINNICVKLEYEGERSNKNVIMVTSVVENEGKSTISVNIALSLVKEGKTVIMIDADMKRPAVYKILDIPKDEVTDFVGLMQGIATIEDVMYEDNLSKIKFFMSTESHSGTYDLIRSGAMRELVETASKMADYVIVDTSPMGVVSDAEAMADIVDYTLLVVKQDCSYMKAVKGCSDILERLDSKFLGCILNDYRKISLIGSKNKKYSSYYYGAEVHNE